MSFGQGQIAISAFCRRGTAHGRMLSRDFLLDSQLAAIVATLTTDSVQADRSATVGAYAQRRGYSLVVRPALVATGLGMVSLRMCHFFSGIKVNNL